MKMRRKFYSFAIIRKVPKQTKKQYLVPLNALSSKIYKFSEINQPQKPIACQRQPAHSHEKVVSRTFFRSCIFRDSVNLHFIIFLSCYRENLLIYFFQEFVIRTALLYLLNNTKPLERTKRDDSHDISFYFHCICCLSYLIL